MRLAVALIPGLLVAAGPKEDVLFASARANGKRFDEMAARAQRVLYGWLERPDAQKPQNTGGALAPYLTLTAFLTDPQLYHGPMLELLRNEVRYPGTTSISATSESAKAAAESAKNGLTSVTELLGRSPWYYHLADRTVALMQSASVPSRFGLLPSAEAGINGAALQVLVRLWTMTGDPRFSTWARRIGDAYTEEVLPGNNWLPAAHWDFDKHAGDSITRLRGNEVIPGLALLYAVTRDPKYEPAVRKMIDRIIESANLDGLLYEAVDSLTLKPPKKALSDTWGDLYGAVYTFYQCNGEVKYREAVRRALRNLLKYEGYKWGGTSVGGFADAIEGAISLVNRESIPEAAEWIEFEMNILTRMPRPSTPSEASPTEGRFNRTLLLYMFYKSQGAMPDLWQEGIGLGAVRDGDKLYVSLDSPARIKFDYARHRRILNFDRNYARASEFPEWYTVDENTLYVLRRKGAADRVLLGSELIAGVRLSAGEYVLERYTEVALAQ